MNERRVEYERKFDIKRIGKTRINLSEAFLDQLDNCKDDDARRLLLGRGEKFEDFRERKPPASENGMEPLEKKA
jgi:hypothetical protein